MKLFKSPTAQFLITIIGAWFCILMFFFMSGCSTTKGIHQEQSKQEIKSEVLEQTNTDAQAETNTNTKTTSETQITEDCDTTVWITLNTGIDASPIPVKVFFKKTTNHKEYQEQDQQKKEQGTSNVLKKEQLHQKSDVLLKDKTVERTGLPWWAIAILILAIVIGVAVLLWRLKVF